MTDQPLIIAIDGPAASGKSTVGQRVAERLGFLYFDTGAMYRAIAFLCLERGLEPRDGDPLGTLAAETMIDIEAPAPEVADGRQYTVRVGERDITWELRHHLVESCVSDVAAHPGVRAALKRQQRRIGQRGRVVMVGRDIGTVVMPEAPLKIYLDASVEERARRRYEELRGRGEAADYEALLAAMAERDRRDSNRAVAPLRAAPDAHRLDSDARSIDEVVEEVVALAERHLGTLRANEGA